ncbi:MAG: SGNH/GDSL hydrolase family protein [Clostridia bacterium]|nr:SGNH/GDSL hydrolase family protein [Clostridia bacterium]
MKIVFFGDSITDCERDRNDETSLGNGYVKVLADKLRPIYPETDIELINKGISGNEVCDLLARVQSDVIDLKPDAVVIMIGINNTIHKFKYGKELNLTQFENDLTELLTRLKEAGIVVIFLEPFLLPAPDKLRMRKLFNDELQIIDRVASEICDEFVAYDEMFNGIAQSIPYTEYSEDGVHPTHRGSRLIADTAIKAIRKHLL